MFCIDVCDVIARHELEYTLGHVLLSKDIRICATRFHFPPFLSRVLKVLTRNSGIFGM
jgi:hypothetical protein